jgi:hypothetical protein
VTGLGCLRTGSAKTLRMHSDRSRLLENRLSKKVCLLEAGEDSVCVCVEAGEDRSALGENRLYSHTYRFCLRHVL